MSSQSISVEFTNRSDQRGVHFVLLEARVCVYVERDVAPQPVECQK